MSTRKTPRWRRVPIQFAVVAAVATGTAGAIAGAAIANDDDDRASEVLASDDAIDADRTKAVPRLITAREQRRLRQIVAKMPAGWPATEVMRRAAEQPLADAVTREQRRLREIVAKMPAGWPTTEVMRRAAEQPSGDAVAREQRRLREIVAKMPAGWPATELMRRAAATGGG